MRASSSSRSPRSRCRRTDLSGFGYDIATSVSLPHVAENQKYCSGTWMRWTRAMRGPLSTRNSSIYVVFYTTADEHSRVTQRATDPIHFPRSARAAPRATRCRCGSVPPANRSSVRPVFARTHEQCVRVAHVAHTQHIFTCRVGSVHVAQVAGVVAHSHRAHHSVSFIREEHLVERRVVTHSIDVGIVIAGSDQRLLREYVHQLNGTGCCRVCFSFAALFGRNNIAALVHILLLSQE